MRKPNALVTGAPGWLGTRLTRVIAEGLPGLEGTKEGPPDRPVRCLVQPGKELEPLKSIKGRIDLVEGDVRDRHRLADFFRDAGGATLFHCAGVIHPTHGVREFYEVNVEGTRSLIGAAEENGVRRLIYMSSNSPFGCNPSSHHAFDEKSGYNPYMNYGKSKMLAEQAVLEAGARGKLETVIVRAPWFYGPDQPLRQTKFFKMIKDGKAPMVGNGTNRRSMAYIDNLCQGLLLCESVESARNQAYWVADHKPYPWKEIIETVERVMEKDFGMPVAHKRLKLPSFVCEGARLADALIQGLGAYNQSIHVLSEMNKNIACSIAKAERELGYDPKIDLEEGMRRSIDWCMQQGITF